MTSYSEKAREIVRNTPEAFLEYKIEQALTEVSNARYAEGYAKAKTDSALKLDMAASRIRAGRKRVNQIDEHTAHVLESYAEEIRSLLPQDKE
jgi:hypothetical protein